MIESSIQRLGAKSIAKISTLGRATIVLWGALVGRPEPAKMWALFVKQLYFVGVHSLAIILVSGLFIGMVLSLQGYLVLSDFGAESALGQMVALSLLRELGPVVTALLFAGRAGSALTAEIGLMKATEQLSSLEMMAVDPLRRIIAPRFWAGIVSMPLLATIFMMVGIFGAELVGVDWKGMIKALSGGKQSSVELGYDIGQSMIKCVVFAFTVTWIAVFNGYDSTPTSEGISRATTQTVVHSSLMILGLDFILTALMFGGN